jgi:hypothetical protein
MTTTSKSFSPSVNDLALYFGEDTGGSGYCDTANGCWVPHDVYTASSRKIAFNPSWTMADLLECHVNGGPDVFYVVNLSKLLDPGVPPAGPGGAPPLAPRASAPPPVAGLNPGAKDLVIIPPEDDKNAYLVKHVDYANRTICPPFAQNATAAQIIVGALNLGVVLANIPKETNLIGWGCFMLSLISLRSGAVRRPADGYLRRKGEYFRSLRFKS